MSIKPNSRNLTLTAVFAALYVVILVFQTVLVGPQIVYGPVQLRVADCLIALAILFGLPVATGVTLGCFLSNAYYFLGVPDVILGPLANLIAALIILVLRKHRFTACVAGALPIGLIVGAYLSLFFSFSPPALLAIFPPLFGMMMSLTISSLITIAGLGYLLVQVLSKSGFIESLKIRDSRAFVQ